MPNPLRHPIAFGIFTTFAVADVVYRIWLREPFRAWLR